MTFARSGAEPAAPNASGAPAGSRSKTENESCPASETSSKRLRVLPPPPAGAESIASVAICAGGPSKVSLPSRLSFGKRPPPGGLFLLSLPALGMLADRRTMEGSRTLASCPGGEHRGVLPQCFSTEPGSLRVATRLGSSRIASGSSLARDLLGVAAPHAHGRRRASTPPRSGWSAPPGRRGRWPARGGSGEDPGAW